MSNQNDGGPAFPTSKGMGPLDSNFTAPGISLRDWFAGMALQGIKSNIRLCEICSDIPGMTQAEAIAKMAFIDADAMLAERAKEVEKA